MVDGIGPSCQWLPSGPWKTVLDFLKDKFPDVDTATWAGRMARGQVVDETGLCLNCGSTYRAGACIFYYRELSSERRIPFAEIVLYEDENILVADKPHFLPVVPAGRFLHETLLVRLRKQGKPEGLVPIHRIDRETAGVVLFSRNPKTRGHYTSLFRRRKVEKVYEALAPRVSGLSFPVRRFSRIVAGKPFFRMKEVEGESNSETYIDMLAPSVTPAEQLGWSVKFCSITLYKLVPITGKKHQLRLHLAALGIPIVNDKLYPNMTYSEEDDFSKPLKLLAKSICFQDPLTGRECYFESSRSL